MTSARPSSPRPPPPPVTVSGTLGLVGSEPGGWTALYREREPALLLGAHPSVLAVLERLSGVRVALRGRAHDSSSFHVVAVAVERLAEPGAAPVEDGATVDGWIWVAQAPGAADRE